MRQLTLICFLTVLTQFSGYPQNRWIQQYLNDMDAPGMSLNISYDKGYLLSGWVTPNYPPYTWLIKTDINGEILWGKFIGGEDNNIGVARISQNRNGEIYLCGSAGNDDGTDPIIIKLNACGEKEWCKKISTTSNNDFFWSNAITPDGGYAALIFGAFLPLYSYRTGILRFSPEGDLLWQQYYQSPDQGVSGEALSNLILTPDHGFLMTGMCYYPDPDNPTIGWLHPYYIKVDSLGNFEWEIILHKETADIGGDAFMTLLNPEQTYYYSCISHYYHSDTLSATRPSIVKIDMQGNVMGVYDLVNGNYDYGKLMTFDFLNDSLLAGSAGWGNDDDDYQSRVIIFDTLGHITNSVTIINDYFLGFTKKTFDGNILILISSHLSGEFDTYLYKLTQDLEQDTFYTTPFVYDSLCPYQIASDTIVPDDCGIIVGIEEDGRTVGRYDGKTGGLEVWPNPCREMLNVECLMLNEGKDYSICIYDIFGRKVQKIKIPDGQDKVLVNVEGFTSGVYIAILKKGFDLLESRKFVVAR